MYKKYQLHLPIPDFRVSALSFSECRLSGTERFVFTMTEMCRMRSSSLAESLAGSPVGSGGLRPPSWWWMWKSSVPFSSHCCFQRTRGMSSELPEISARRQKEDTG
ncbi:hypothetical protein EYF80_012451 [Liparis tanakae]|uniref:Uncharacterized protein n=1 Tax=Liparis tanakae TaxID=230148 RepID=A0A4Z2IHT1_9TELE|nr:hypothetical protein EYF80_012451 [Liparis tanakae]